MAAEWTLSELDTVGSNISRSPTIKNSLNSLRNHASWAERQLRIARTVDDADAWMEYLIGVMQWIAILQRNKELFKQQVTDPAQWSLDTRRMRDELAQKAAWYESVTGRELYISAMSPATEQVEAQQAWYSRLLCRLFGVQGCGAGAEDQASLLCGAGKEQGVNGDRANTKKLQ